ncbi:unnamed protein product [Soboliphyme baturini]|uniref:DNA-directed RNA polymerase II subunit RPB7 n=1 Tax=Soboliphyme baturini TaxID=241478 RepID=A0A183J9W5_9BILA|nr:unnamed protein product [Soboliphyme baturini]
MYYHMFLTHDLLLHPRCFGSNVKEIVKKKLYADVEGKCINGVGIVICVTEIASIGDGVIQTGHPHARFHIKYKAVVFRPYENEVIDARVTGVVRSGIMCNIGPISLFISRTNLPPDYIFDPEALPPSFCDIKTEQVIQPGVILRARIVGTRVDMNDVFAVGSLLDEYLGVKPPRCPQPDAESEDADSAKAK